MSTMGASKIVKDGLVFYLDAANPKSYVSGDTIANDLISNINGTLENGTGFLEENNGSWSFDGSDDIILVNYSSELISNLDNMSIEIWMNVGAIGSKLIQIITNNNFYYSITQIF